MFSLYSSSIDEWQRVVAKVEFALSSHLNPSCMYVIVICYN